jgi:uncharacterized protein
MNSKQNPQDFVKQMQMLYIKKKFEMITLLLIVIGALNWGLIGFFKFNLVEFIARNTFKSIETVIYMLVGLSALFHILSRNFYLPFLGDTVFPCNSMVEKVPENADTSVKITTIPNSNIIFWAAEHDNEVKENPWIAYVEYSNAGVAKSDVNGVAVLNFRKPAPYKVKNGWKTLVPHVHYRVCKYPGMLSEVKTVFLAS